VWNRRLCPAAGQDPETLTNPPSDASPLGWSSQIWSATNQLFVAKVVARNSKVRARVSSEFQSLSVYDCGKAITVPPRHAIIEPNAQSGIGKNTDVPLLRLAALRIRTVPTTGRTQTSLVGPEVSDPCPPQNLDPAKSGSNLKLGNGAHANVTSRSERIRPDCRVDERKTCGGALERGAWHRANAAQESVHQARNRLEVALPHTAAG